MMGADAEYDCIERENVGNLGGRNRDLPLNLHIRAADLCRICQKQFESNPGNPIYVKAIQLINSPPNLSVTYLHR